jgi:hypothetical protein
MEGVMGWFVLGYLLGHQAPASPQHQFDERACTCPFDGESNRWWSECFSSDCRKWERQAAAGEIVIHRKGKP